MAELPYRYVIGLEVHVQLLTRTKLFCGCSTAFGLPPNSATCPVCLGLPGVLPVMNRRAFDLALRAAVALNCTISRFTKWDRKNYYYPDLPKNYQISQYDLPLGHDGHLEIATPAGPRKVGIIRVHLEEDAGKLLHDEAGSGQDSLVDLNRTGTPLAEIVGQPELTSPEEAKTYLEEMALLMRQIGVSDCQMQEGSLRCDANVNVHIPQPDGGHVATPIVEIKNLNSFRFLERAIRHEAQRQYEQWRKGPGYVMGLLSKETAGWDDRRGQTTFQRRKEEAADYRYFPEPDLVPVVVDDAWLARIEAEVGELPSAVRARLARQYGLSGYDVGVLVGMGRPAVAYFEEAARVCGDGKAACNWITNQVQGTLKEMGGDLASFPLSATRLGELIATQKQMGLPRQTAAEVYARMLAEGKSAAEAIAALGIRPVADTAAVVEIVRRAMAANPKAVADYKGGKAAAANAIKGAIMRETRGSVRPDVVEQVLKQELEKA
jgi:aspartyl-tRNA(Asn)/glutamyl-tRNA(Gln) amidotransferase subunit B